MLGMDIPLYDTDAIILTRGSMLDSIGLARHQVLRIAFLLIAKNFVRLNWKAQFLFCKDHGSTRPNPFYKLAI